MNIPQKKGIYRLNIGSNTLSIDIHDEVERLSRLDQICLDTERNYQRVLGYSVKVMDSNGVVVDSLNTADKKKYVSYVSSLIGQEGGASVNPDETLKEISYRFQKDTSIYVVEKKFNGIVKNKMKFTLYLDSWANGGLYDESVISNYFANIGVDCKIAAKRKDIGSYYDCFVVSLYLPLDFKLNENRNINKKMIRLTENDLRRIVKESVNRVLNESTIGSDVQNALNSNNPKVSQFRLGNVAALFQQAMVKCGVDDATYQDVNNLVLQWIS